MRSVARVRTRPAAWPARRFFRVVVGVIGAAALVPAAALAQGDSARTRTDTTGAIHAAAGKRSRLGALGRAAAAKANGAANKVEEKTGISKEAVAQAAIASTGVGAAAMMAKSMASSDSGAKSPAAPTTGGRSVMQRLREARAAHAAGAAGAAPATPRGPTASMSAQQMALYQQQMALAQSQAGTMPAGSAEMQRIQAEYLQLVTRASAGDSVAARQVVRFSQEWSYAAMRVSSLAPDRQQAAYETAMRDAMRCATTGAGCRAPQQ